jgi:hypothetical protein
VKNKLLLIPRLLLIITNCALLGFFYDILTSYTENGLLLVFLLLIVLTIISFFEPKLVGILLSICTFVAILNYLMLVLAFGGEFRLFERIPILLILYLIISVLLLVFSRENVEK